MCLNHLRTWNEVGFVSVIISKVCPNMIKVVFEYKFNFCSLDKLIKINMRYSLEEIVIPIKLILPILLNKRTK